MIHSMTGYGKVVIIVNNKKVTAELKSLNSKQLDLSVRIPQSYHGLELEIRNEITRLLRRGKIDLIITAESIEGSAPVTINTPLLKEYKHEIEVTANELGIPTPDDWYATLLRLPDSLKNKEAQNDEPDADESRQVVELVCAAADALNEFRRQEGAKLETFFEQRIAAIQHLLDTVPQYELPRVEKIRNRITEALEKIDVDYDKNRLEQELIFYIEKLDITEEKTRLQNHLNYFLDTLHGAEQQGKKLGFITQEMGREINTMGSKANEAELQKLVVEMKDNLEQIKEQVLNVL